MRLPTIALVAALGVLAGCTDRATAKDESSAGSTDSTATVPGDDGGADDGTSGDGGSSTGVPGGGGTSTGTDDGWTTGGDGSDEGDGGIFIGEPDGGPEEGCDPGLQDCPEGEKCTAYVTEPGYCCVDANKCVPVIGDKVYGEECTRTQDNDDCAKGFFCMTKTSGDTGQGFCLEFCVPGDDTTCEYGGTCVSQNDGVLPLCEEGGPCDPVLQDCPEGLGCYLAFDTFICAYSQGPFYDYGEDCYTIQSCLAGLVCVNSDAYGPDCTGGDACCTAWCDINDGGAGNPLCVNPAHECVPWFWPDQVPEGLEHVGACMIPP
jgi:hypothetical protein